MCERGGAGTEMGSSWLAEAAEGRIGAGTDWHGNDGFLHPLSWQLRLQDSK